MADKNTKSQRMERTIVDCMPVSAEALYLLSDRLIVLGMIRMKVYEQATNLMFLKVEVGLSITVQVGRSPRLLYF